MLQELYENKKIEINEFHYGTNYKQIANDLYNTVKSIGGYGVEYQENGLNTVVKIS